MQMVQVGTDIRLLPRKMPEKKGKQFVFFYGLWACFDIYDLFWSVDLFVSLVSFCMQFPFLLASYSMFTSKKENNSVHCIRLCTFHTVKYRAINQLTNTD